MKKILAVITFILVLFVALERQRLYIRDPLATLTRNGVKENGAQIYINFSNDVLIENDNTPIYVELLQHPDRIGAPIHLNCAHWLACLLESDTPAIEPAIPPTRLESMTGKTITFRDAENHQAILTLH